MRRMSVMVSCCPGRGGATDRMRTSRSSRATTGLKHSGQGAERLLKKSGDGAEVGRQDTGAESGGWHDPWCCPPRLSYDLLSLGPNSPCVTEGPQQHFALVVGVARTLCTPMCRIRWNM